MILKAAVENADFRELKVICYRLSESDPFYVDRICITEHHPVGESII